MYGQQSEELMESHTKKKGWLALSSTASVAVLSVGGSIIITIILLGGVNLLFASSSFQMPGMMAKNMTGMQNMMTMMAKNMTGMQNMMTMMAKRMTHHHHAAITSGKKADASHF